MTGKQLLKKLRIRKEVFQDGCIYYFVGQENSLRNIETKLENCSEVKKINGEFFTDGFGRLYFELN